MSASLIICKRNRAPKSAVSSFRAKRSHGVGRRLVAVAEEWARQHGLKSIVVRSRATREAAHRFYLREGYTQTKTSAVFTKSFGDVSSD
jgi:GNAT superfamily N-acetyltransferase